MITQELYEKYFQHLLQGNRPACTKIVQNLLDKKVDIKSLYVDLFQKSLYKIGELWEYNKITVAREHMVTALTESLMSMAYPYLFEISTSKEINKKALISCTANEHHQVGGKMVADIFEMQGWDTQFLGANTPADHMLSYIQEVKPEIVGLSLSVYFNLPSLKYEIEAVRTDFSNIDIIVGGQAFKWGGTEILKKYPGISYIQSLDSLEKQIKETS
ncbi:cobalamin B12-binding domain protein [Flexistipes sinusarabici DSM 4947]|uniref:Cobalamin B12-binding domain protein n=2 Tax=Flexistipes sinusarabici TaxID=2352 RepID=F8E587_FLESM|nr:cobalamin-dependent protein [Flexistipes sinusarabici]AEI14583.1 cobalamin B12-binding domain protein [Flexistipes sinusarabici DSM 4947]HCW92706.1 cobalamin-binding protein [Flexistipes sinusarabici]